jgi:hypothetical protein
MEYGVQYGADGSKGRYGHLTETLQCAMIKLVEMAKCESAWFQA